MERSSFFNSVNIDGKYDRAYTAEDFANYFSSFIGNGVFSTRNGLRVVANNKMQVEVQPGKAWINGYMYENTDSLIINIHQNYDTLDRLDRIVIRFNANEREIRIFNKVGKCAHDPEPPKLQRDSGIYELCLAEIYVESEAAYITDSIIEDSRFNKEVCGLVHTTIEHIDSTVIFNQFQSWYKQQQDQYTKDIDNWTKNKQETFNNWFNKNTKEFINKIETFYNNKDNEFNEWFSKLKNQLQGDVITKIQSDLNDLQKHIKNYGIEFSNFTIARDEEHKNIYLYNKKAGKYLILYDNDCISYAGSPLLCVKKPNFKYTIIIPGNNQKIIKHNLGYCPITEISGEIEGVTWKHIDNNSIKITNEYGDNLKVSIRCW